MKAVIFIKPGAPYGYGYNAGEAGSVKPEDFTRLESLGVVKEVNAPAEKREKAVQKDSEKEKR